MNLDVRTLDRLAALLASPDFEGDRRGHRVTVAGDPKRRQTVLLPLLTAWAQRRFIANDPEPFIATARLMSETERRIVEFRERELRRAS